MPPPRKDPAARYEHENNSLPNWRPIPDPTLLTTQQLMREISSLKELFETRLNAMDTAVILLQAKADRSPSIDEVVVKLDEKFAAVQLQFHERDLRFDRAADDGRIAINAAFTAAKIAVDKTENGFTKQIDQLVDAARASVKAIDDKIDDVKSRIVAMESRSAGIQQGWGWITTGAVAISALAGAVGAFLLKH